MKLTRSDEILKYIVEHFIKTAQPVASQTLIDEYKLPYSSATIRNEMFALEKMGLIEKTHTSSGRIPSSQGYKYYCDHLREQNIDEELKYSLQAVLNERVKSVEEVIKASCEILSHMTSLVSVVTGPNENNERLANVQLVQISDNTITAVFVTDKGYVENKTFIINETIKTEEVVSCMKLLNDRLIGTPISQLLAKMQALEPILKDYVVSHDVIYKALMETFLRFASDRLSLYGRDELFNNPEFKNDAAKLEKVFKLLNNANAFKEIDKEASSKPENNAFVKIGDSEKDEGISTVTAKLKLGEDGESSITLVGPTRMDYAKALSALEYMTNELNKYFEDLNKGGNDSGQA